MKNSNFVKGDSDEAKFESIERALQRISRKTVRKVGVEVPPIPISKYQETPENGVIQRYMFPASGYVEKAIIFVETFPEDQKRVPLYLDIMSFEGTERKNLTITPILNIFNVGMRVVTGARFVLKLQDPEIKIAGVWSAFLYQINIKHNRLQNLLVDKVIDLSLEYRE